jgi:hypothetical protein
MIPRLRYLRKANDCNYCHAVRGFVHDGFGRNQHRLHHVRCLCGKKHLACFDCARKIGSVVGTDGMRKIRACAKRYFWKNVRRAVANGGKGA